MAQTKVPITIYASKAQYNSPTNEYYITINNCQVMNTDLTNHSVQIKINKNEVTNIPFTTPAPPVTIPSIEEVDNDTLLVSGFCHQIQHLLFNGYIAKTLIQLCQAYCHNKTNDNSSNYSICSPIITMAVGGCGINLANTFFTTLFDEFQNQKTATSTDPNDKLCTIAPIKGEPYFHLQDGYNNKIQYLHYMPFDCDPQTFNIIKYCRVTGRYSKPDYFVFYCEPAQTWSNGHYGLGAEFIDEISDVYRNAMVNFDSSPQAIQMFHSLDGGTGSGLGSLIMQKCKDEWMEYKDINICNFTVFPNKTKMDTTPRSVYNSILGLSFLNKYSDSVFVFDNNSLNSIVSNKYSPKQFANNYRVRLNSAAIASTFEPLNNIVNAAMNDISTLFRTKYTMNDVKSILNPFGDQYMKYYALSSVPLNENESEMNDSYEFTKLLFESDRLFCNGKSFKESVNISTMIVHRNYDLDKSVIKRIENEMIANRINDIVSVLPDVNSMNGNKSATMITNTTAITDTLKVISKRFDKMFKRKAYVHLFTDDGMELDEFVEARQSVENLICKYNSIVKR